MGIYRPDRGTIKMHGRVGGVLELGTGFHPEFSGRENVFINGIVLGLSKREVRSRFDEIVRFAELEAFIDEPVKTYSLGMYMRLGFSVAVHADPDILLIDEVLAVGDEAFQQKCFEKIGEFRRQDKTIILVSHDLASVERWSDETAWLDGGIIREQGESQRVVDLYRRTVSMQGWEPAIAQRHGIADEGREGTAGKTQNRRSTPDIEIVSASMVDASGLERYVYHGGEQTSVVLCYKVHLNVEEPIFWIAIYREDGLRCLATHTVVEGTPNPPLGQDGTVEVSLERLDLIGGKYWLDTGVSNRKGYIYDSRRHSFVMRLEASDTEVSHIPHRWTIKPGPQTACRTIVPEPDPRRARG
jgi:ABC-type multidrug transport system ATPase subunit